MRYETSAGGIVYKKENTEYFILIAKHSGHHGWVFPKGIIGDTKKDETKEETAIREVQEETGILAEILRPLSPITYWYLGEGEKRKKTVYYFLMRHLSGDTTKHDWEMEEVEWVPADTVAEQLTYPGDKKVWKEAQKLIEKN